jgi:S1-C subfamily serine protease
MVRQRLEKFRPYLFVLVGSAVTLAVMFAYLRLEPPKGRYTDKDIKTLVAQQMASATPTPPVPPQIYAMVRPSVVLLTHDDVVGPDGKTARNVGSGVVIDASGLILTAYHVVSTSDTVNVRFFDGTRAVGHVTQKQPDRDLAVVQVPSLPQGVNPATLGGGVAQGDAVLAIGAPFGFDGSVTSGVVSALNRAFVVEETGQQLTGLIQFDAAVNPGNSGGPLVDLNGRVVGIVTGIVNPTGQTVFIGLGFAVPIESANGIVAPLG